MVLTESVLSAVGCVAGLVLARGIVSGLSGGQGELPRAAEVHLDGAVATFSIVSRS
jgi:hypothetical protein